MKTTRIQFLTSLLLAGMLFTSVGCSDDEGPVNNNPVPNLKTVQVRFVPVFGDAPLMMDHPYQTAAGDTVLFTLLKFYVSGFSLVDTAGGELPLEGLGLVDFSDAAVAANGYYTFTVQGEPGTYRGLKFDIGVPFDQNHRDVSTQVEPLGPNSGMYWGWNPGYVFCKVEGKVDSMGTQQNFLYHIGEDNRRKTIRLASLSGSEISTFVVADNEENVFTVKVDVSKFFAVGLDPNGPLQVKMNPAERTHHVGPKALADRTATNFSDMFRSAN